MISKNLKRLFKISLHFNDLYTNYQIVTNNYIDTKNGLTKCQTSDCLWSPMGNSLTTQTTMDDSMYLMIKG